MNRGIYSLANGMLSTQQAMDVAANNLANVGTSGFKADNLAFNDALEQAIASPSGRQVGTLGSGATVKQHFTNLNQGQIQTTNAPLDLAISGKGMFAVQGPNGQTLYTRDGAFSTNAQSQLVTKQGYPVLDGSGRTIQMRPGTAQISKEGGIATAEDGKAYAQIGLFDGTFTKSENGLYSSSDAARSTTTQVTQGAIEASNVSPITSMIDMISLGRNFETAQKSILAEDEMTQKLNSVLS